MKIERIQGGSVDGIDTHETVYFGKVWRSIGFREAFDRASTPRKIADPFARNCSIAWPHTNDIDPSTMAKHNMDAIDFLKTLDTEEFDMVIFDPPFSPSQEKKYDGLKNVYATPGYVPDCMKEIGRALKPGGYLLKFGYNSTNHLPSVLDLRHCWLVNIGGNRNDVVVTLWRKTATSITSW